MTRSVRIIIKKLRCNFNVSTRDTSIASFSIKDSKPDGARLELESARPYTDIPGPKAQPLIGNIFRFIPPFGKYSGMKEDQMLSRMRAQYGNIVRLEGVLSRRPHVFLFDVKLCEQMYRLEGPMPMRIAMECLQRYQTLNKDRREPGFFTSQGEEWYNLRSRVNQPMLQPRTVRCHVQQVDQVARDFVDKMRELRDPTTLELPANFNHELEKWALESVCLIALDHRLGCFEANLSADSEPRRMIRATAELFDLFYELEIYPSLFKYHETRKLERFYKVVDTLAEITNKHIANAMDRLKKGTKREDRERSMLERLLLAEGEKIARTVAQEMLFAGIDSSSSTTGKVLYMIAAHPRVQDKLRVEVEAALPSVDSPFTYDTMNELPYLKACVKEALRISPLIVGILRTMPEDVILGGYRIPKGMDVIAAHAVLCKDEEQFPEPDKFIPERWIREAASSVRPAKESHPFAYMPFGFGPRSCAGRRFAMLQMEALIARVVRRFRLEWHHGPLEIHNRMVNSVKTPLRIKLLDR